MNKPDGLFMLRNASGPATLVEIARGVAYEVSVVRGEKVRIKEASDLWTIATKPEPSRIVRSAN